jgi:hypothetical protein
MKAWLGQWVECQAAVLDIQGLILDRTYLPMYFKQF